MGGLHQRFIDRQRMVKTLVTHVIGPRSQLSLAGAPITAMIPLVATSGNLTISMAVLSCDRALSLVLMVDPNRFTDLQRLMGLIGEQLNDLAGHTT